MKPVRFDKASGEYKRVTYRALQIYLLLIGAARMRQVFTYKIVSKTIGYGGAGVLNRQLGCIMEWCADRKLPPLTALVLNQTEGRPGAGLNSTDDPTADLERVFAYDWLSILPPSLVEIEAARTKYHKPQKRA